MNEKTITYEQIEQRLKNKPQEQWTKDDNLILKCLCTKNNSED